MSMKNYLCSIFKMRKFTNQGDREIAASVIRIFLMICLVAGILIISHNLIETRTAMVETEKKVVYLTFDDGPSWVTPKVLEVLKENNVKATFFLIGNEITEDREAIIKQMQEQGHEIGIHTYCHKKNEIYCSSEALLEDIKKTYDRIYEVTGEKPTLYRFPWGSDNCYLGGICGDVKSDIQNMGLTYFDWNVSGEDSMGNPTTYSIIHNIEKNFTKYNEPVILLHDSKINELTSQVLPQIIEMIKEEGYDFDTLENRSKPLQYRKK